jgi:hypothetical protein
MGNPAWIICKMSWSCSSTFFSGTWIIFSAKRFYIFSQTVVLFFWDYFSTRFIKALYQSSFIILQSALLLFKALLFSFKALLFSSKALDFLSKRFYSIFLSASTCLFFILNASQRLFFILLNMKQCPIFCFKTLISVYFNFWNVYQLLL